MEYLDSAPLNLVYYFPCQTMVLVPLLITPPRFPGFLAQCILPVSSLFYSYCLLSVRFCSVGRPPPAASGHLSSVRRKSPDLGMTSDRCPSPGFLSSVPYEVLPPPDLCGWWYLARVWVEGQRRRRPPGMVLSSSTRRQASPRSSMTFINALGPSSMILVPVSLSAPPPPFTCTTVRVPITSLLAEYQEDIQKLYKKL